MVASRNGPKGAEIASFGLAILVFLLTPTQVGYQDLAALLAQQPAVAARWREHLIASPFGTIHAATFSMPRPIGMAIPETPLVRLASLNADDVTGSIGQSPFAIRRAKPEVVFPVINRPGKNDNSAPTEARPGVEVPMRTTSSGFLSGEVAIEGIQRPLNFIFDTGATTTVLSEKLAALDEAQGFIQKGRMRVVGAAGIAENVKMALLPKLAVGTYTRQNIDAAVLDLEPVNETSGFQQSGILGGNFLRYFRVVFDFQRGIVRLEPLESSTVLNENAPRPEATTPRR